MNLKIALGSIIIIGILLMLTQKENHKVQTKSVNLEIEIIALKQKNLEQEKLLKKLIKDNLILEENQNKIFELLEDTCSLENEN